MSAVAHIDEYKTGRFYTDEYRGTSSWNGHETNVLLRNEGRQENGSLHFSDVAMAVGVDDIQDSRGFAVADFDHDGDLDFVVNHNPGDAGRPELGQARLYQNQLNGQRPWIVLELQGTQDNRDAVGSVVTVTSGDLTQTRRVELGSGYASQHTKRLYFGLGDRTQVDHISVRWPSGQTVDISESVAIGGGLRIIQDGTVVPFRLAKRPSTESIPATQDE